MNAARQAINVLVQHNKSEINIQLSDYDYPHVRCTWCANLIDEKRLTHGTFSTLSFVGYGSMTNQCVNTHTSQKAKMTQILTIILNWKIAFISIFIHILIRFK